MNRSVEPPSKRVSPEPSGTLASEPPVLTAATGHRGWNALPSELKANIAAHRDWKVAAHTATVCKVFSRFTEAQAEAQFQRLMWGARNPVHAVELSTRYPGLSHPILTAGTAGWEHDMAYFDRLTTLQGVTDLQRSQLQCWAKVRYRKCSVEFWRQVIVVNVPEGVKEIPISIFAECENLRVVVLPPGLQSIRNGAFWGCRKLKKVSFRGGHTRIEEDSFRQCPDARVELHGGASVTYTHMGPRGVFNSTFTHQHWLHDSFSHMPSIFSPRREF